MRLNIETDAGYGDVMTAEEGCSTPRRGIPERSEPPPPPRKKPHCDCSGKRQPPKSGYFQPPDLEMLFAVRPRQEACV